MEQAMLYLAQKHQMIVEGAGAMAFAAMSKVAGAKKVGVVSGGNIDAQRFSQLVLKDRLQRAVCA